MITKEKYKNYQRTYWKMPVLEKRDYLLRPCWHCLEKIKRGQDYFSVQKHFEFIGKAMQTTLYFHEKCWLQVAGNDYNIENFNPFLLDP